MKFRTLEISNPSYSPEGMQCVTVKSAALGQRADVSIYIAPEFSHLHHLPIVTLLHGVYGSHWSWAYQGGAHLTAANLMRQGQIEPMVLVMPSDGLWGDGSGYVAHASQDFERWIVEEVPEIARQACASCDEDSPLFIAGLSMGGFAALRLAAKYPTVYKAAAAHSAVTKISQLESLIEETQVHWSQEATSTSVLSAIQAASQPLPPLRFDCGQSDVFLIANRQLHQSLVALNIAHEYEEHDGGHDWSYWQTHLADSLIFFSRTLK